MSFDVMLIRAGDGSLRAAGQTDLESIQKLPIGKPIGATMKQLRNGQFHRKLFALIGYLFDVMPRKTAMYKGRKIEQSAKRFRDEMVILSGHYTVDVTRNGDLRMIAQSLKYKECSQSLAETIYSDLINKALELLGDGTTRDDLDEIVANILRFDG